MKVLGFILQPVELLKFNRESKRENRKIELHFQHPMRVKLEVDMKDFLGPLETGLKSFPKKSSDVMTGVSGRSHVNAVNFAPNP